MIIRILTMLLALVAAVPSTALAQKAIKVGMPMPLSGPPALFGDPASKGAQMFVEEINAKGGLLGRQIKIIYSDTKSDIAYGATAAQDVIDKGASMVVVTCDYDFGSAAASVADSANLIAFST